MPQLSTRLIMSCCSRL